MGSTRLGAWILSRTLHHFDEVILRLSNNKMTLTSVLSGLPIIMLTSQGAKSGLLRTVPLLGIPDETGSNQIALIASNYGQKRYPGWYYNLKANPQAKGSIGGQMQNFIAHEAEGEEYNHFWQAATDIYTGFSNYRERIGDRRHIPIMVLTPVERSTFNVNQKGGRNL
jgi:deazaflavin-dependent oxidoreductase (nitroreductase family)